MKNYLIVSGTTFSLIALAHVWRLIEEGAGPVKNPWFILTSVLSVTLAVWAWRLLRRTSR
jgi:hypothetical protein